MPSIEYRVELEQPLLAAGRVGDPNSSVSLDYLPGSLLRGCLIHRYCRSHNVTDPMADPFCRHLFFGGNVRYLHAYPLTADNQRSVPTPATLLAHKGAEFREKRVYLFNASHVDFDVEARREAEADGQLEPVDLPFLTLDDAREIVQLYAPERSLAIHIQRSRRRGRATSDEGAVFQYQAVAAWQRFAGVILIDEAGDEKYAPDTATVLAELHTLCRNPICWLGGSRSAGYGRSRLSLRTLPASWQEITATDLDSDNRYTLILLSDALLRDHNGHPIATPDPVNFADVLGRVLSRAAGSTIDITSIIWDASSVTRAILGGYNATWQLPLPQAPALAAGSVITFTTNSPISAVAANTITSRGIGERRAEGFGRIVLNWDMACEPVGLLGHLAGMELPDESLKDPVATRIAQDMADRLLRAQVEERILIYVRDRITNRSEALASMPNRSQLAWLGQQVQKALLAGDDAAPGATRARLLNTMSQLESVARQQFERARLANTSLQAWLEGLLAQPSTVWSELGIDEGPQVAGATAVLDGHTERVALQLIAAVAAAARRGKEDR